MPKTYRTRRKRNPKRKNKNSWKFHLFIYSFLILCFVFYHYRSGISYYFNEVKRYFSSDPTLIKPDVNDIWIVETLENQKDRLFGFDVSHYQSQIEWQRVDSLYEKFPIHFVFVRSTMGTNGKDFRFKENWNRAKGRLLVRGAYHYYHPDENSTAQALHYIKNTPLSSGDFIPILDIEDYPKTQTMQQLKLGIANWLKIVEKHYAKKPMIYSGKHFYETQLQQDFGDYPLWIGRYNFTFKEMDENWDFWQFTDRGFVNGVPTRVDLNIFNGNYQALKKYVLP